MTRIENATIDTDAKRDVEIRPLADGELDAASGGWVAGAFALIGIGAAIYAAVHD